MMKDAKNMVAVVVGILLLGLTMNVIQLGKLDRKIMNEVEIINKKIPTTLPTTWPTTRPGP
jgi:hypothetical protein